MKNLAERHAQAALSRFETGASDLMEDIGSLSAPGADKKDPNSALLAIAEKAHSLLPAFEAAFGSSHLRRDQAGWWALKPSAQEAASVHQTLRNLVKSAEGSEQTLHHRAAKLAGARTGIINRLREVRWQQ